MENATHMPLILAHRGASGVRPENTMPAFVEAVNQHADGIELDIQLTKDGRIVVCHDEKINRTSNGKGYVKDYTLEELKKFSFDNGMREYAGVKIPEIDEVLELLKDNDMILNIELKTNKFFYGGIEDRIVAAVERYNMTDRAIYSSFNHYTILRIKELSADARTAFLVSDGFIDMPGYSYKHGVEAIHPSKDILKYPDFLDNCDKYGVKVNVWTINSPADIKSAYENGVNAIITNYPDRARSIMNDEPAEVLRPKKKKAAILRFIDFIKPKHPKALRVKEKKKAKDKKTAD